MKCGNVPGRTPGFWMLVAGLGLLVFFSLSLPRLRESKPSSKVPRNAKSDFGLMAEAWNTIEKFYVDRPAIKPSDMTYGAISGMVNALGDTGHSTFMTPDMIKEEEEYTAGEYKGIGAEVKMKDGHVVVVTPLDGSPAQKAGLRPGDVILAVDGKDLTGLHLVQAVQRISGPAGTHVTLTVMDPATGQTRSVTVERASITVKNVTWHNLPGTHTAHLRIAGFSEGVTKDLNKALEVIEAEGLKGLVLDLRNDPGGLLDEAVGSASQFLKGGNVLLEKNAEGKVSAIPVRPGGVATQIPMVVLVNGGTASAAEIIAGALQDADRAVLVGEKTFGTGTVLEEFHLSDGSALLLAVEEWLTPDGKTLWHKGITPNRVVSLPPGVSPLFPEEERAMTAAQLQGSKDEQLLDALAVLSGAIGKAR
jgi:carboxyl-terminal processing protease